MSIFHLLGSSAQPMRLKAFFSLFLWCLFFSGILLFRSFHFFKQSFIIFTWHIWDCYTENSSHFFLTTWPLFFYQKLLIVHTTVYYATPHLQCLILRNSYNMGWNFIWHSILVSNFLRFHEIFFLKYHPIICKYVVWILWKYLKKTVLKL